MKTIKFIITLLLCAWGNVYGQKIHYTERNEPNFDSTNILPAHLIVEGTITKITYFSDTTIKFLDRDISYDDHGVWFAKYEVEVHKIFKGTASKTINIISPLFGGGVIEVDEKKYKLYGTFANTNKGHNYQMHNTGIFFLYINSPTDTGYVPNTYRFKKYHGRRDQNFIGGYDNINYGGAGYYQDSTLYGFNVIEDLYKFVEKCTHQKSKDISHKKFELLNNYEKRRNFINTYFGDSIASETFKSQLENGIINQYNKDVYPYNSQNKFDKTTPVNKNKNLQMGKHKLESIKARQKKRNIKNKTGILNKTGESISYTFANFAYNSTYDVLDFDIQFTCNNSNYLAESNVILSYNLAMFGPSVYSNQKATITRGNFILDAAKYSLFEIVDYRNDAIMITASGNNLRQFLANTPYTIFHVSLIVLPNAIGGSTQLGFDDLEMGPALTTPGFYFPSLFSSVSNNGNSFPFSQLIVAPLTNYTAPIPIINSISTNNVIGGVDATVVIFGLRFGFTKGKVQLPSADKTTNVAFGDYINIPDADIVYWSDTKITVKIPSTVRVNKQNIQIPDFPTIGTGKFHVISNSFPNTYCESHDVLDIKYSMNKVVATGTYIMSRPPITNSQNSAAILVNVHTDVFNNINAIRCIIAAMKQWRCVAGINFKINKVVNYTSNPNENIIYFNYNINNNMIPLMETEHFYSACPQNNNTGFNIAIKKDNTTNWTYDTKSATISNQNDFYNDIMHELGHAIGLAHTVNNPSNSVPYDLMYYNELYYPKLRVKTVTSDDASGASDIIAYSNSFAYGCGESSITKNSITCGNNAAKISIDQIYLSHQCASIMSSIKPVLKTQISDGIKNYHYFWEELPGNDAVIDNANSSAPSIISINNIPAQVKYKLTVYDNSDDPKMDSKIFNGVLNTGSNFDYAMCDSYEDDLAEPNTHVQWINATNNIWHSQDLWNRINKDGGIEPQNPRFDNSQPNYVYTRIRNIGCIEPTSDKYLRLYWTVASIGEKWADDWTTGNFNGNQNLPAGKEITDPLNAININNLSSV